MREDLDEYIVLALMGRASPNDLAHLQRWRQSAAENDEYFNEVATLWQLTGEHPAAQARGEVPTAEDLLERSRELFLESHHLGDKIRYGLPFTPAPGTPYPPKAGGFYGDVTCFPLPDLERLNNPNIGG